MGFASRPRAQGPKRTTETPTASVGLPALRELAATEQPWPPELARDVAAIAWHAVHDLPLTRVDRAPMVAQIVRATGRDLAAVVEPEH